MSIRFTSTRGDPPAVGWARAIDGGTAPGGGLWVPVSIPGTFDDADGAERVAEARSSAASLGGTAFSAWAPSRAREWLDDSVAGADLDAALDLPIRTRALGPDLDLLDLTVGPTGAFKDVGARVLAALWGASRRPDGRPRMVLTATSGDTGGAVAAAVDGVPGLRGVVVFPLDRVSEVQRRQFTTRGDRVRAVAVRGTFDDCQAIVRAAFEDERLARAHALVSANSINPGRLLPQSLYYGWLATVAPDRPVVVPSGNLGNVTSAVIARRMGARLGSIHAAVNENDALVRAARGQPPSPGAARRTDASAMDVARPSNLERLRWLAAAQATTLGELVDPASIGREDARRAQRWAWTTHGTVVDPHTAVGIARALQLEQTWPGCRPIVVETAHPAKFPDIVRDVLGRDPPDAARLETTGEERWATIDADLDALARELEEVPVR